MSRDVPVAAYYADPAVRARIREYCGAAHEAPPSCMYVASLASFAEAFRGWAAATRHAPGALDELLAAGGDIARSIWDARHFVVHFDVDYLNVDFPGEPFLHQADTFLKLEPVYLASRELFARHGLRLLTLMTGRGYHFVGRLPLRDPVVERLAALAPEPAVWWSTVGQRQPGWMDATMPERLARAYIGAGLVYEFIGDAIARRAAPAAPVPITFNGTMVGSGLIGRECISIDLSASGDPLDVRHIRVGFGAYLRHRLRPDLFGRRVATDTPPIVTLPRGEESTWDVLTRGRGTGVALDLARSASVELPFTTAGMARAVDAYEASPIAAAHRRFYDRPAARPDQWPALLGAVNPSTVPACVAAPLARPNDLLLQPAPLQHVTRYLLAEGWHPRDVAGLVHARYAADCGWGDRWRRADAGTRAEFDVRVFATLLESGLDGAIDFNCCSAQDKNLCPGGACPFDLRVQRDRLLTRVAA